MLLRRVVLSFLLLFSIETLAVPPTWTDLWWVPTESGWGLNAVQQNDALFLTFFVYDQSTEPYWVVASLVRGALQPDGWDTWTGSVYASKGPWYGGPFDPAAVSQVTVGSATFSPQSTTEALLTYAINGVNVTKTIQRQGFQHINLTGSYLGGYAIDESTCSNLVVGASGPLRVQLSASVNNDGATGNIQSLLSFDGFAACALTGTYVQGGSIYTVSNQSSCTAQTAFGSVQANYELLVPTLPTGIAGDIVLSEPGCTAYARMGAVFVSQ
jgi:hypothetical protein